MNKYFVISPESRGAVIYLGIEEEGKDFNLERITHCFYDDFSSVIPILIKEKETDKFKIFKHLFTDYVIAQLKNIENTKIEVIENV